MTYSDIATIPPAWLAGLTADDKRILDQMAGEESQFFRLYIAGEPRANHTASEADFELALMGARHTRDPEQIKRLMESSPLARTGDGRDAKWSRHRTYLDRTIGTALQRENEFQFLGRDMKRKGLIGAGVLGEAEETQTDSVRSLADFQRDPDAMRPPAPIIPRLAWAGRVTLLASSEGWGKSTFARAGAAAVTTGQAFLDGAAMPPGDVLWARLEESEYDCMMGVSGATRFGADPNRFLVWTPGPAPVAELIARMQELRPALTVIDSIQVLATLAGVESLDDAAQMGRAL